MATITSSAIVNQWGEYFIDNGQNESDIKDVLRETFQSVNAFTVVQSDDTVLRSSNAEYGEVLQAFQKDFTPKGSVTFTPKEIPLFNVKVDLDFTPDDLKNQWLQFMIDTNTDRTTWPIVRWIRDVFLMKQIQTDLEKNFYGAVRAVPTSGVASAASAAFNGVKKVINAGITAGTITPIATGAPSATKTTWCTQIESFCEAVPELYQTVPMDINTSRSLARRYRQGRRDKYNTNYEQVTDKKIVEDFEDFKVEGYASMTGKTKIWATPKSNAILAYMGMGNQKTVEVEKIDRKVKMYTDFWVGIGFIQDALVFTNDQELS